MNHEQIAELHRKLVDRLYCTLPPNSPIYLFIRFNSIYVHIIFNRPHEAWEIDFGDKRYIIYPQHINTGIGFVCQIWHISDTQLDKRNYPEIMSVIDSVHSALDIVDINISLRRRSPFGDAVAQGPA